ncbi:hypothetical protein SteCoe_18642 [Stentor coeruleus]|uniref:Uncharacterized protein n=1 Tax=Stentor coeruleus TaxID=5963 RepID=A0A1R2BWG2_9CILI|nr:hypothetical protein SteCoe_18642 [Stentor coeruleus]
MTQIEKIAKKDKISITDLDDIESNVKSYKNSRLSNYSPAATMKSKTPDQCRESSKPILKDLYSRNSEIEKKFFATYTRPAKKKVKRIPDNQIFPTEHSIDEKESASAWQFYSNISPNRIKKDEFDVWNTIHKADSIKYKNEIKTKLQNKKIQQNEYKHFLMQQMKDAKFQNRFNEENNDLTSLSFESSYRKLSPSTNYLREMIEKKREKMVQDQMRTAEEDQKLLQIWKKEKAKESLKAKEKHRKNRELSLELISQMQVKNKKLLHARTHSRKKSRELLQERLETHDHNEKKKQEFVLEKTTFAHDEERLRKLLPKNTTNDIESFTLLSLPLKDNPFYTKARAKEHYLALEKQIKAKYNQIHRENALEALHGMIVKENDRKALLENKKKRIIMKMNQKKIREELYNQVNQKEQLKLNEGLFTDNEAKINRKIFESSIATLQHANLI